MEFPPWNFILGLRTQIVGVLCVYSLYSQWKDEKNVNRRLRDLTMVIIIDVPRN